MSAAENTPLLLTFERVAALRNAAVRYLETEHGQRAFLGSPSHIDHVRADRRLREAIREMIDDRAIELAQKADNAEEQT